MLFHFRDKFPQLNTILDKYHPLQERLEVPAKTTLLEEGKKSRHYIFIEKGCVRAFFNKNGEDITVQFFFENQGVSAIDSFVNNIPSQVTLETIEPSILYLLSKEHVYQLLEDVSHEPGFVQMFLQIAAQRQTHYSNEFISFIRDTPEQRYQNLLNERPHIIQRVPQHYIASYLGVSKVHLSRIKSKLANGKSQF